MNVLGSLFLNYFKPVLVLLNNRVFDVKCNSNMSKITCNSHYSILIVRRLITILKSNLQAKVVVEQTFSVS